MLLGSFTRSCEVALALAVSGARAPGDTARLADYHQQALVPSVHYRPTAVAANSVPGT